MSEKFESLKDLTDEYCGLVEKNCNGLPPYATFRHYLENNDQDKCINRPEEIKNLINQIYETENEEDKIESLIKLFSHGGDIYVEGESKPYMFPKLIHSVSNTTRLQVFLEEGKKGEKGVVLNKEKLNAFSINIAKYIKSFQESASEPENPVLHKLKENSGFKGLIKNNIDSVVNELLFWYYYQDNKYSIINSRAKKSKHILNKVFPNEKESSDIDFINKMVSKMHKIECNFDSLGITKQLLADQLFYSLDEMKSMKKVEDEYNNKTDEVYKFYKKLWNTIKEGKANLKLQEYYNIFNQSYFKPQGWYEDLKKYSYALGELKKYVSLDLTEDTFTYDTLNKKFKEIINSDKEDFLQRYLFEKYNGIASGGQGLITNNDRKKIKEHEKLNKLLYEILTTNDIDLLNEKVKELIGNTYHLARYRFLAAFSPEKMTTVANRSSFESLIKNMKKKALVPIESESYLEQNNELMGFYLKNGDKEETDINKKQIFYWWLYEFLNDNLDLKKAIVYYGAPGTGKTYKAKKVAKEFLVTWNIQNNNNVDDAKEQLEIVQFHPSFSYEDFIEGIRPSADSKLKLQNGVFKKFCKKVGEIEIALWHNDTFRYEFKDNNDFDYIKVEDILKLENKKDILEILKLKEEQISNDTKKLRLIDIIPPAFFVIDEINRADLSRVFGELMYALEYRGYEGKIKTQYSYLVDAQDNKSQDNDSSIYFIEDNENWFFIPQNLYIIGTMNTIDRSVDSFDFALRRRFSWEEIEPKYVVIEDELDDEISKDIAKSLIDLNDKIKENPLLGNDYQIGHSYALNLKNTGITKPKEAKKFLWDNFIHSLLQEYFRGLGESENQIDKLKEVFDK